jgi:hypothetical protein
MGSSPKRLQKGSEMTDSALTSSIADLARLRAIAEEGRRMPLLGGRHLILWGSVVALASALHGAVVSQFVPLPMISIAFIWFGLTGLANFISRSFKMGAAHKHNDVANRVERSVWQIGGAVLWLTPIGILAAANLPLQQTGKPFFYLLFATMPSLTFGVYAIALRVAAEVSDIAALRRYALLSLAFVPICLMLVGSVWQFVAMSIGILLVSILPGRMMLALEGPASHD